MRAFEIKAQVNDQGQLPIRIKRMLGKQIKLRKGKIVRIYIGNPKRSTQANGYYRGIVLPRIRMGYLEAGMVLSEDDLHEHYKRLYLPERVVEIGEHVHVLAASTASLDSHEFYEYIERIRTDDDVLAMGVDIPDPDPNYKFYALK